MSKILDQLKPIEAQTGQETGQEKAEREPGDQQVAHKEHLRFVIAKREKKERQLPNEEQASQVRQHEAAITDGTTLARDSENGAIGRVYIIPPSIRGTDRYYIGLLATILLIVGVGYFMTTSFQFFDDNPSAASVQPAGGETTASVAANLPAPEKIATIDQAAVAAKQQEAVAAEVRQTVMQWAEAWSRRDIAAYLSYYAADFNLPEGMRRADWEAQRQSRLRKYRSIEVTLKNIQISHSGSNAASVSFTQDFQADKYRELGVQKELRLKKVQGRWLIANEKSS